MNTLAILFALMSGLCSPAAAQSPAPAADVLPAPAVAAPLKVIATTPTYGDLARDLGRELVDVVDLCRPAQDMHQVGATPSQMARMQHADLVLYTGLDAEPWLEPMLRSSGNLALLPGNRHVITMSDGIPIKEVPAELTRALGDIHAYGNPHVWSDPLAVRTMAERVRDALVESLPGHAEEINTRHKAFHDALTGKLVEWLTKYERLKGRPVVTYHKSWPYFLERFGIEVAGTVEPKPRVAPTASHLEKLVEMMKARGVKVIIREPFQAPEAADFLAERTGARVLELSTHPEIGTGDAIIAHFEHDLAALAAALDAGEPRSP
jgi:zinc/manganese transport system substrate-binding protein